MTFYEKLGYRAFRKGEPRFTELRGSAGRDFRAGWDRSKADAERGVEVQS